MKQQLTNDPKEEHNNKTTIRPRARKYSQHVGLHRMSIMHAAIDLSVVLKL